MKKLGLLFFVLNNIFFIAWMVLETMDKLQTNLRWNNTIVHKLTDLFPLYLIIISVQICMNFFIYQATKKNKEN